MTEAILHNYGFNLMFAQMLVKDVADDRMAEQPKQAMNHPAWILGHLAHTCDFMGSMLNLEPHCPTEWNELFANGTTPTADRGRYPDKQTLLKSLEDGHQIVSKAYAAASADSVMTSERLR